MMELLTEYLFSPALRPYLVAALTVLSIIAVSLLLRNAATRSLRDTTTRYRVKKFISFLSYLAIAIMLMVIFGGNLSALAVSLGVAGAGIAFALQEVIASVAGWIAITFGSYYKPGDRVMIAGIRGDVIDISLLRTTLFELGEWVDGDLYNGRVVRIANAYIFKEPVYNYSGDFPFLWDELILPISFESDRATTRALIESVVSEHRDEYTEKVTPQWEKLVKKYLVFNADPGPTVTMSFDENFVTYTIRYVVDYGKRRATKDRLYEALLDAIQASNGQVQIPSASQEITIVDRDKLDLR